MYFPLADVIALLGINLVLCAVCLRVLEGKPTAEGPTRRWTTWFIAALFLALWLPAGTAHLPLVAYVRGISADPSVTLVTLAALFLFEKFSGDRAMDRRERMPAWAAIAASALFLYPSALGWGDWDSYRQGWSAGALWVVLLCVSGVCWFAGWRLLPALVATALLAWTAGLLESRNLWDYLLDPWLAIYATAQCVKAGVLKFLRMATS